MTVYILSQKSYKTKRARERKTGRTKWTGSWFQIIRKNRASALNIITFIIICTIYRSSSKALWISLQDTIKKDGHRPRNPKKKGLMISILIELLEKDYIYIWLFVDIKTKMRLARKSIILSARGTNRGIPIKYHLVSHCIHFLKGCML